MQTKTGFPTICILLRLFCSLPVRGLSGTAIWGYYILQGAKIETSGIA